MTRGGLTPAPQKAHALESQTVSITGNPQDLPTQEPELNIEGNPKLTGACYIGVVGSELELGQCRDSILNIEREAGDTDPLPHRATKGYEARQEHLNNWYNETDKPFILLLDSDMIFPADTLKRLRGHGLPYVTGFYMRRTLQPVAPVWFDRNPENTMPMRPMTAVLEDDKLYPIGAGGWGCVLIHRSVVTAMKTILRGEPEIIEDDMDVWPYDWRAVNDGREVLRVLRGVKDPVGSDIRFPFYARAAGFTLWGDTGVSCGHVINYPLVFHDYIDKSAASVRDLSLIVNRVYAREAERLAEATK